jgi:hypothetical protein
VGTEVRVAEKDAMPNCGWRWRERRTFEIKCDEPSGEEHGHRYSGEHQEKERTHSHHIRQIDEDANNSNITKLQNE